MPIVRGATKSDYKAISLSDSFIFAADLKTSKELAKYLKYRDKNNMAYKEYFSWITKNVTETSQYGRQTSFCHLCGIIIGINVDNIFNPNYETLNTNISIFGYSNKSKVISSVA